MRRLFTLTLSLILFLPAHLFAQSTIRGIVFDSLTLEPLPMATVYINGTTQGTTTDNNGRFELKDVSLPATVVFSYVGYQPKALVLNNNPGKLTIGLTPNIELPEILVSGKKNKADKVNMEKFKSMFLGDDRWGKRAAIKNENVLVFDNSAESSYFIRKIRNTSFIIPFASNDRVVISNVYDDTVKVNKSVFTAWAYEPLIIDLPLLGYELYVDLVEFSVLQVNNITTCNILGYFYYKPYEKLSKRKTRTIEENRKQAYYGSSQHFLRSLAKDRLAENGYVLTMPGEVVKGKKSISMNVPVDLANYSADQGDSLIQIYGLNNKNLKIRYYHGSYGKPANFEEYYPGIRFYSESGISFLKDTCVFRKDGILVDNSIRFTGDISKRRVGACLPDDYISPVDTSVIKVGKRTDYDSELIKFAKNIQQFNGLFPQEKVYLEFDNTAYFQGENIWFKAFVTHASTLERAPSGVLYVDFLAPTGQLILQQKLKVEAGQADGVIPLLDVGTQQTREKRGMVAYPSGFYEIRAYTQNMLDFSQEAVFSRVIPVYTQPKYVGEYNRSHVETDQDNPLVENLRVEPNESVIHKNQINVRFYPEGGVLVNGIPNRVAFKVTGKDGFGLKGKLLVPGVRDTVHTVHDGMGSFVFIPGGPDLVNFYAPGVRNARIQLPQPVYSGYSMMADMLSDSRLQVTIWRTPDRVGEQTALAVTCRGEVIHFEEIKDIENSHFEIDCSDWPAGVCRVTLYDKDGMILSSRSIFHSSADQYSPIITVNTDSMSDKQYGKEVLEFRLADQEGNPMYDRFCLSVRDAADYGSGRTENLKTNLLLSSDLRGYIHDPAWYLECDDSIHREALNLLTMVQGWERYEWQTMTGLQKFEEKHRVEEGLTVNGWILSYRKREPLPDISIYSALMPDDDKTLFESYDYETDSTGYFGFDLSDFYGKGNFTIHLMSKDRKGESKYDKRKRIRFERADRPEPRPYFKQETDLTHNDHQVYDYKVDFSDADLYQLRDRNLGTVLDAVDVEEEASKRKFIDYDTFTSFQAEEETELELDMGEYTTDVEGYFLDKGIRFFYKEAYGNTMEFVAEDEGRKETFFLWEDEDSHTILPHFYVHSNTKGLLNRPEFENPLRIDMIHVKSIIVYDKPMTLRELSEFIPHEVEERNKHIDTEWFEEVATDISTKYYLIDIQIKEERELLHDWEIRNLSRRATTVKGFNRPVQFYSPEYPEGPIEGNVDARRTLYWNPNVITDKDGRARVEFYNNGFSRKFTINAAGITASGIPYILNQNW